MSAASLLHLVPAEEYNAIGDAEAYQPHQFAADGFIHCTQEPDVLLQVANNVYRDAIVSIRPAWRADDGSFLAV